MRADIPAITTAVLLVLGSGACEPGGTVRESESEPDVERVEDAAESTDASGGRGLDAEDASSSGNDARGDDAGQACESPHCVAERFRAGRERNCDDDPAPARCEADPAGFGQWGPASAVTHIEFQSERARECCFNLDDSEDGSVDNAFGELVADLPIDVDRQIQANLAAGTFVALGEYQGLEDFDEPQDLEGINIYLGMFGGDTAADYVRKADPSCRFAESACQLETRPGKRFLVNPAILEEGTHPEVQFPNTSLEGSSLEAGPTELVGQFNIPGLGRHRLTVRGATFEATIDREASSVDDGLVVEQGRIGGYVLVRDLIDLLNAVVGHCDCLGNPGRAVTYPGQESDDVDYTTEACERGTAPSEECRVRCKPRLVDLDQCSQISNLACGRFPEFCLIVDNLAGRADLDVDGDGQLDALSFGAIYEMTGAQIGGVGNYVRASDRQLDAEGRLEVDRVFANREGWLAAFEPRGGELELLGHTAVGPGNHVGAEIELPSEAASGSVMLVPYADDGPEPGTFEPEEDSQLRFYPGGDRISTQLRVLPR